MFPSRVLAPVLLLATLTTAGAQEIAVPQDLIQNRLSRDGQAISFCYHAQSPLAGYYVAVAQAVAGALLVEPRMQPIESLRPPEALDYRIPFDTDELFLMFDGRCNAFLGFTLSTDYPEWLLVTRPYLSSDNVLVVNDPAYQQLSDVPKDRPLGTRMFSAEDAQLTQLIGALPPDQQWRRHPYRNYGIALERAIDGSVGASIVWEAGVYLATDGDPGAAGLTLRKLPFPTTPIQLGFGVPSNDRFLEQALSQAIDILTADGTLAALAVEHHLAPQP
jgi:polar amino acid transport system substrate-binding protein